MEGKDTAVQTLENARFLEISAPPGQPFGFLTKQKVDELEEQVVLYKRAKHAILKITDAGDWLDISGNPYLTDSGVHKVASISGVDFGIPETTPIEGKDDRGKWARFKTELSGIWTWSGRRIGEIGMSSTRDDFFAKAKGNDVPFDRIDLSSVEKKSVTNAQHRVLTKLLGLGGVSWEQLQDVGIERGKGSVRSKGQERKQEGVGGWTEEKNRLWGLILEIAHGDEKAAAERLLAATKSKKGGYKGTNDPKQLSDKQVQWLVPRIEEEWRKLQGEEMPEREPGQEG